MKPSDVFVPGKFPIRENNIYADRGSPQITLRKSLERSDVPVVFGSYGVGKSSLVMYCGQEWAANGKLLYIESVYGKTLKDIFEAILEHFGYEVVTKTKETSISNGSGEVGSSTEGGLFGLLKGKFTGKLTRGTTNSNELEKEVLIKSPTDRKILELCENAGLLLVIDELHQATETLRKDLSAFIKAYANKLCNNFKICLLGTENDANALVIRDAGIDRTLQEVELSSITVKEAEEIIAPGMNKLGLSISANLIKKVATTCVGSPFVVQYLSLEMAENTISEQRDEVTETDFENAMSNYANRKAQRLVRAYMGAVETVGSKRYRKQILHAMAFSEGEYVTMNDLVRRVSKQLDEPVPSSTLSGPLRDLKTKKFGEILRDIEGSGKDRLLNYSAFSDPAMRSIIRMIEQKDIEKFFKQVLDLYKGLHAPLDENEG